MILDYTKRKTKNIFDPKNPNPGQTVICPICHRCGVERIGQYSNGETYVEIIHIEKDEYGKRILIDGCSSTGWD